jgi:hypothetical protein
LLQGIIWCGGCGRQMTGRSSGSRGHYPSSRCGMAAKESGGPYCQEVRGLGLNAAVEQLVLEALAPERLVLALDALEQLARAGDTLEHQWPRRLERVRYEAQRAQRQDAEGDPAHRLVARFLEHQWEDKLRLVEQTEHDYATWKKAHHTALT